jgi:hypothetical protein
VVASLGVFRLVLVEVFLLDRVTRRCMGVGEVLVFRLIPVTVCVAGLGVPLYLSPRPSYVSVAPKKLLLDPTPNIGSVRGT